MKKILLCSLLVILLVTGCGKKEKELSSIIVSFNPEFLVTFNKNKVVVEIKSLNEDSKIYLNNELLNLKVDEFVDKFVEVSKENGYLQDENVEVTIKSYEGDNKDIISEITVDLKEEHKIEAKEEEIQKNEKKEITETIEKADKIEYKEPTEEEKKELEEQRKAEEAKQLEEQRKAAEEEAKRLEAEKKAQEEAKRLEEQKKAEEEKIKSYDYNLNKTNTLTAHFFTTLEYVYPQNSSCVGKDPWSITIPEGETYNSYCQNVIPTFKSVVKGKGYYCNYMGKSEIGDISFSKEYECSVLTDVVSAKTIDDKINKIVKINNAFAIGGGRGGEDTLTLTKDLCTKYSLNCGKW